MALLNAARSGSFLWSFGGAGAGVGSARRLPPPQGFAPAPCSGRSRRRSSQPHSGVWLGVLRRHGPLIRLLGPCGLAEGTQGLCQGAGMAAQPPPCWGSCSPGQEREPAPVWRACRCPASWQSAGLGEGADQRQAPAQSDKRLGKEVWFNGRRLERGRWRQRTALQ